MGLQTQLGCDVEFAHGRKWLDCRAYKFLLNDLNPRPRLVFVFKGGREKSRVVLVGRWASLAPA